MKEAVLAAILPSLAWAFGTTGAAQSGGGDTGSATAAPRPSGRVAGKRMWDMTRIADREKTRLEFPDLIRFKGNWYCAFREGEIHGNHPSGRGRIIRSSDGEAWESVALMAWDSGDVRDPRLSITADGHLMLNSSIYFVSKQPRSKDSHYQLDGPGTPSSDLEMNVARQSVTWLSPDGEHWGSAYACPSGVNTWRWHVTWHNGMGYSVGYTGKDGKGTLYRTRDGKSWRVLLNEFFPDGKGNEAALAFGADDTAYCLLRGGGTRGKIGIGKPPYYQQWQWKDASVDWQGDGVRRTADAVFRVSLGGPKLIRLSDGRLLGAGRVDGCVTLFWVDPEKAVFTKFVEADGTSYPGVVEHEGMIWVTYGLSDASGIFLAKAKL